MSPEEHQTLLVQAYRQGIAYAYQEMAWITAFVAIAVFIAVLAYRVRTRTRTSLASQDAASQEFPI